MHRIAIAAVVFFLTSFRGRSGVWFTLPFRAISIPSSIESCIVLQVVLHQVFCGLSASELVERLEEGTLHPPLDLAIDAMSSFEAFAAADVTTPAEPSLIIH